MTYFQAYPCQVAVDTMVSLLDSSVIFPETHPEHFVEPDYAPQSFIFVAFKKELGSNLKNPDTKKYLRYVRDAINSYLIDDKKVFNLWDVSLKFHRTPEKAAAAIATLFQDTSDARLHLKYFERTGDLTNQSFKQNLDELIWTMESLKNLMRHRPQEMMQTLYPRDVKGNLNGNIYHFYVPLHLNYLLKEAKISSAMSYNAALIMTLTYEFITTASDYRYLFDDPKTLAEPTYSWKLKDIYAGYLGVNFASKTRPKVKQDIFIEGFGNATYDTVHRILIR